MVSDELLNQNTSLINKFYTAFQQKDWKTMQSCYHNDATFHDPVFQDLTSQQVKAMWHMLAQSNADVRILYEDVQTNDLTGSCHWEAFYKFSKTGRDVHNIIDATYIFKDGKIYSHRDKFSLWKWAGMALGTSGLLLGWSPFIRDKIRLTAEKGLQRFIQEHPEYQ